MISPAILGFVLLPGEELPEERLDPLSMFGKFAPFTSGNMVFGSILMGFEA